MQPVGDGWDEALGGSATPLVKVDAWYDGDLILQDVPLSSGSVVLDDSRTITGTLTLVAGATDESLAPTSWSAPLAPYGSELHIRAGLRTGVGVEYKSLGWYRIDTAEPTENWKSYPDRTDPDEALWANMGTVVEVTASDRMSSLDDARFVAPEAPLSLDSVHDEIVRLAQGIVPVSSLGAVPDAPIPASVAYQTSRVQAIQDLAGVVGHKARIGPNGALTLVPKTPSGDAVWTVRVGVDNVRWSRKLDRTRLYNAVVSTGSAPDGSPVQGVAVEVDGPLRFGGPFGRVPYGHSSPLLTTNSAAESDARTRLANLIEERVVPVHVTCIANPALELDDIVDVVLPDATLTGPVAAITWPLPATSMDMVVMVPRSQIWR